MSIICYRNGVMASDSQVWACDDIHWAHLQKMIKSENWMLGVVGYVHDVKKLFEWFGENPENPLKTPVPQLHRDDCSTGILVNRGGDVFEVSSESWSPLELVEDFIAIGGPLSMAFGAMAFGASAIQAVQICIQYSDSAGGRVCMERF